MGPLSRIVGTGIQTAARVGARTNPFQQIQARAFSRGAQSDTQRVFKVALLGSIAGGLIAETAARYLEGKQ